MLTTGNRYSSRYEESLPHQPRAEPRFFFFFFSMMLAKDEMQGPKIYLCKDFQHSFIIKGYLFGQKFLLLEILSSMSAVISLHSLLIEIYKMLRCLLDKNLHISSI